MSESEVPEAMHIIVQRYMTKELHTVAPGSSVLAVARTFLEHRISGAPVIDADGQLVGVVSEKDLLKAMLGDEANPLAIVSEVMSTEVVTVPPDMSVYTLASVFRHNPYRRLPVVHESVLVGQISRSDLLRCLLDLVS